MHHLAYAEIAPLAPALPAVGEGLAALFPLLLWGLALALLVIWRHTVGALLEHLAHLLNSVSIPTPWGSKHLLGFVASGLQAADYAVQQALSVSANATERAAVYLFHKSLTTFQAVGRELYRLAEDTGRALQHVILHTIPHAIRVGIHGIEHKVAQNLRFYEALIGRTNSHVSRLRDDVHAIGHATTVALPRDIGRIRTREGLLERDFSGVRARLKSLEKILGAAAFAGLVVTALGRLGLRWLRCGNVRNVGRRVCGMDPSLIESLLADTLLVLGTISLVEFAQEMQGITAEGVDIVRKWWRVK